MVLAGYFGFGNAGDELIAETVRRAVPGPWRTLGVDASRWNPLIFRRSKALVYGGGELFQTRTSRRSLFYYAALPRLARACGAKFIAYGMGLDAALSGPDLSRTVRTLDLAERLWFRDEDSLSLYRRSGGRAPASWAPDPAWTWAPVEGSPPAGLRRVLWIPRDPADARRILSLSAKAGGEPGFLRLHPGEDAAFRRLPGLESWKSLEDLVPLFRSYDAVVSMRYHGLVLAALAGRPAVALAAHGKTAGLARELGFPALTMESSAEQIARALAQAFEKRAALPARDFQAGAARGLEELKKFLENL